jgi:activator of 2-hydroxyglutaryl-CoA dehydratase
VEVLAAFFKIPMEELGKVGVKATKPTDFLNTCAVYVESEALSLLLSGEEPENVVAGALRGFASRILSFLIGIDVEMDVAMVGGLAGNQAVVKAIEENLGAPLFVPKDPEITMAFGAALIAQEKK